MWDMILRISKGKQLYAMVELHREVDVAVNQARDFARRFPKSEGFVVQLYRWQNYGEPIEFQVGQTSLSE